MKLVSSNNIEFSIAVLCYKSEEEAIPFIEKLHAAMSLFSFKWEIVLVANYWPNTPDRTPEIVKGLCERLTNTRYIAQPKQGAMGWDMKAGLDACRGRYIGIIDGDGQFPIEAILSCFAAMKTDKFDFVKTYRVMRSDSFYRNLISMIYNRIFTFLFPSYYGWHDVNSKPKLMKRSAYEQMELLSTDWFIDAEIMLNCLQLKLKMYEIPVAFRSLDNRTSFVKIRAIIEFMSNLLAYRFNRPPFKRERKSA